MSTHPDKRPLPALTLCALAALAACGGGGGGNDTPQGVVVPTGVRTEAPSAGSDATTGNAGELGAPLVRAVLSTTTDGLFDITGAGQQTVASAGARPAGALTLPLRLVRSVLRVSVPQPSGRRHALMVSNDSLPCVNAGGSMQVSIDDADDDNKLSAGDSVQVTAVNCVLDVGLPSASGSFEMRFNAVELAADETPTALDVSGSFEQFAIADMGTMNGSFRLWSRPEGNADRMRLSYRGATLADGDGPTATYDFDVYGLYGSSDGSFDINGGLVLGGQTYALVGGTAFRYSGSSPPDSGSLRLVDAAGDSLRLTARSATTLDLDFLPSGASTPTLSMPGLRWDDYMESPT